MAPSTYIAQALYMKNSNAKGNLENEAQEEILWVIGRASVCAKLNVLGSNPKLGISCVRDMYFSRVTRSL